MDWNAIAASAAALLAVKFGDGFSGEAGKAAWGLVAKVRERVVEQFRSDPQAVQAIESVEADDALKRAEVERLIAGAADRDEDFASDLAGLLEQLRRHPGGTMFFATAHDQSKQVNITGDNHGQIRL